MNKGSVICWLGTVLCLCVLAGAAGCEALSGPPALEWPGPHAPYPFPDDVPHRTS